MKGLCGILRQMGLLQYHGDVKNYRMSGPDKSYSQEPRMLQVVWIEDRGPDRMMNSQWTPKTHVCPVSCLLSPGKSPKI